MSPEIQILIMAATCILTTCILYKRLKGNKALIISAVFYLTCLAFTLKFGNSPKMVIEVIYTLAWAGIILAGLFLTLKERKQEPDVASNEPVFKNKMSEAHYKMAIDDLEATLKHLKAGRYSRATSTSGSAFTLCRYLEKQEA